MHVGHIGTCCRAGAWVGFNDGRVTWANGAEIDGLRRIMLNVGGGIIVALIGVIAAILARGV